MYFSSSINSPLFFIGWLDHIRQTKMWYNKFFIILWKKTFNISVWKHKNNIIFGNQNCNLVYLIRRDCLESPLACSIKKITNTFFQDNDASQNSQKKDIIDTAI